MRKIVALPRYEKQAKHLLSVEEREAMEAVIAENPLSFPVIPRTGGFLKRDGAVGQVERVAEYG